MFLKWYHYILAVILYPLVWIYRLTIQALFNIGFNFVYMLAVLFTGTTSVILLLRKRNCLNFANVVREFSEFKYSLLGFFKKCPLLDRWPTWTPLLRVLAFRDFTGNCQHAMKMTVFLLHSLKENRAIDYSRLKYRTIIYVPLHNPFTKIHYFVECKYLGINSVFTDGAVFRYTVKEYLEKNRGGRACVLIRGRWR